MYFVYSPYKLILKISSVPGYHTKKTTFPLCLLVDREGFSKLRNIINSKTEKEFTEENVGVMLFSFLKKMLFEEFDKTLQQRASKEELVENYVNYYEENALTWDKLYFFVEYLKTKYSDFSELIEVKEKVSKLIENKSVSSFEKQLLGGNNISLQDLDKLTGVEFEEFLKKLFEKQGYKAILTPASNDYGADLILEKFGKKIAVQAKRYENTVPSKAIQEVYAAKDYYACQEAWIVTQSELSRNSIRTAEKLGVKIIDREKLKEMI